MRFLTPQSTLFSIALAVFAASTPLASASGLAPAGARGGLAIAGPVEAQDFGAAQEDEVPDKREEIKEMIKTFVGHTKKKGKEDTEAVKVLDNLLSEFPKSGPKDRVSIVKALEKSLTLKRKDHKDGTKEARVAMAAAVCLGEMGPESVKPLISITSGKKLRGNPDLFRRAILSLGKTEDGDAVKPLLKLAGDKTPMIQGAAVEALGMFRGEDQDVRKAIVEELLKMIMPIKSIVDTNSNDTITREQYDVVGPPTITTLQRLTDQNMRDFVEWQQWWNKNKKRDWDEEDD